MGFGEEDYKGEVHVSPHHMKGTCRQDGLSLMMVILITWLVFGRVILLLKVTFLPFPYYTLEESRHAQPTLTGWRVATNII